jgi:SAM-dependent methyltransferase
MDNRRFDDFDAYARDYRRIHSENLRLTGADSTYFAEMRVRMLQPYEHNTPMRVLDLGCGDGVMECFIRRYYPKWDVDAIDVSAESIAMARQLELPHTRFAAYDGLHIPFETGTFDLVLLAGVLHHVSFDLHANLLQDILRVLKPGGRLVIYEHNPLNPLTKRLVNTCVFDRDARLLRCGYLRKLLNRQGFIIQQRFYFIFIPPYGWLRRLIPLERFLGWLPAGGKYFIRAQKSAADEKRR